LQKSLILSRHKVQHLRFGGGALQPHCAQGCDGALAAQLCRLFGFLCARLWGVSQHYYFLPMSTPAAPQRTISLRWLWLWRSLPLAIIIACLVTVIGTYLTMSATHNKRITSHLEQSTEDGDVDVRDPMFYRGLSLLIEGEAHKKRMYSILGYEVVVYSMLLALACASLGRRAQRQSRAFRQESIDLRLLNEKLRAAIEERDRVGRELAVAEQTIAQSTKLAALGEMSTAISHELNQPLAAMKTYLSITRVLSNKGGSEALDENFDRLDSLLDRMGALTRQLKSYARKGDEAFGPMDIVAAVEGSLSLMKPQLDERKMQIITDLPDREVIIEGDRLRLEQVLINLYRNALDATANVEVPEITVTLEEAGDASASGVAILRVRDNGAGITNPESLFEPFATTKAPGKGVGLGLAISSRIIKDFGGRLKAKTPDGPGAMFEIRLPLSTKG
jgi:C4-dicarboxylate-specific signal transduction histidine kinase